jgi:hypothetical protein
MSLRSLTSYGAFKARFSLALGLPLAGVIAIMIEDLEEQALNAPRLLPHYFTGNVLGYNAPRLFQHYGWPHFGGALSNVAVFILNVHTCVTHNNQTALRFGMPPLSLRRYLS